MNTSYNSVQDLSPSHVLSKNVNIRVYAACVLLLYGWKLGLSYEGKNVG